MARRGFYLLPLLALVYSVPSALAQECEVGSLPAACYPPAEANLVAGLAPVASNTCGQDGPERVCHQVGAGGSVAGTCEFCDASVQELAHPPQLMTDPHPPLDSGSATFWQSQSFSFVQYPNTVLVTFPLNKTFEITRIAITFQSGRPESYAIYKSDDYGASFTPFQYYSLSCNATYGVNEGTSLAPGEEAVPLCTSLEARLTPLSGGEAVFQPLQHRPSAESFASNAQLQEWVRATHLQLRLNRLNTFGDAILTSDPKVLDSYYYAISNVEVSGQCFCNGHASTCSENSAGKLVCDCEHNTAGPDCGQCQEFYQDRPWAPASPDSPAACAPCECNNHSSVCRLDEERYAASGMVSGGVCEECGDNTEGVQCERCQLGYYPNPTLPFTSPQACMACECDPRGSEGGEASCQQSPLPVPSSVSNGQCQCKANVDGRRCSECKDGFHSIDIDNPEGCQPCGCVVVAGTVNSSAVCDKDSGQCDCQPTLGGRDCGECQPGYFNFMPLDDPPCLECRCFVGGSVSGVCDVDSGDCECRNNIGGVATNLPGVGRDVLVCDSALLGFYCPGLGLVFEAEGDRLASGDIVQGPAGQPSTGSGLVELSAGEVVTISDISVPLSGQYSLFLRHGLPESPGSGVKVHIMNATPLSPSPPPPCLPLEADEAEEVSLSHASFTELPLSPCLLSGASYSAMVTALNGSVLVDSLVATPTLGGEGPGQLEVFADQTVLEQYRNEGCLLDHVALDGGSSVGNEAFCQRVTCSATFELFGGALPCDCAPEGSTVAECSAYRGQCSCLPGFMGRRCDLCTPGNGGPECRPCSCDPIGSLTTTCNRQGQCVCKPGVGGATCNTCLTGYYNQTDEGCAECACDPVGSDGVRCDEDGACLCHEGVGGKRCEDCEVGYFNLTETGCSLCPCPGVDPGSQFATSCEEMMGGGVRCEGCREGHEGDRCQLCADGYVGDPTGEVTGSALPCLLCNCNGNADPLISDPCDLATGACISCLRNTAGDHCETCARGYQGDAIIAKNCTVCPDGYYWLPDATCASCGCHENGSVSAECEDETGRCECVEGVTGDKCDVCGEGFHVIAQGCIACPACYDHVATEFNTTLTLFSDLTAQLNSSLAVSGGLPADLLREILVYQDLVAEMLERAQNLTNQEADLTQDVASVAMETDDLEDVIGQFSENISRAEAELAQISAEGGPAVELLQQLRVVLEEVRLAVRIQLQASLTEARESLDALRLLFDGLVSLSTTANETSTAHYQLALSLLSDSLTASSTAQRALQLLSEAINLQNETTVAIAALEERRPSLDASLQAARDGLRDAELNVPSVLARARAVLDLVLAISLDEYDTSLLESRLRGLQTQTGRLVSGTTAANIELEQVEREVSEANRTASSLIAESQRLNRLAAELLGRAHAASSFANQTVQEGNEFIAMVRQLLQELQERLGDTEGFVSGLEQVIQNVELAEELAGEAEEEGRRRRGEVREAARLVDQAAQAMDVASTVTARALEAALRVNQEASVVLSDANLLSSESAELATNVSASGERLAELEGVAVRDAEAISMTTRAAQTAISEADELQADIRQLLGELQRLRGELDSAELLPGDRLEEVGSEVTQLESQAEQNQVIITTLQEQVELLAASSAELRERHVSLQQHRDLLQSILGNVQSLDCRDQFQSIN